MILFFGPPGSGKSVQGQLLVKRNGWQWLSTGELFRESKNPEVLERLATGELIDDNLTNSVVDEALDAIHSSIKIVLDGYPRNLAQVEHLVDYLSERGREVSCVVLFDVPREELIARLSGRGRAEDSPEVISRRLDIYEKKTKPVIEYYKEHHVPVVVVDGMGAVNDVHERIHKAVMECQKTA